MKAKPKLPQNLDPFAKLISPFAQRSNPKEKPRRSASTENINSVMAGLIRRERIAKGWTQQDLAARANVVMRQVSQSENGSLNFTYKTLSRILAVLGFELVPQPLSENRPDEKK